MYGRGEPLDFLWRFSGMGFDLTRVDPGEGGYPKKVELTIIK